MTLKVTLFVCRYLCANGIVALICVVESEKLPVRDAVPAALH